MTELADETPPRSRPLRTTLEWVVIIAVALMVALAIKTWLFQPFYIPSPSMEPTLQVNARVLVAKQSRTPGRGDIVVFSRPPGEAGSLDKDIIKRVIGLPGDTVEGRDGVVHVNGAPVAEPYLPPNTVTETFAPVRVEPGRYWVMGDNRANSHDSRRFGPIAGDSIIGRAFVVFWPPSEFQRL